MPSENIPRSDPSLGIWLTNFATIAAANATDLGLTTAQTAAMTAAASNYNAKLTAANTAKNRQRSAVQVKNNARTAALDLFGPTAKTILANPEVEANLKVDLGMTVAPTPPAPVSTPIDLSATAYSNGATILIWKRGANAKSVSYVIEAKIGLAPNWTIVGTTQRVKFTDEGRTPGQMITYRVSAVRGGVQSLPSNEAVVYSASSGETIYLSQAA